MLIISPQKSLRTQGFGLLILSDVGLWLLGYKSSINEFSFLSIRAKFSNDIKCATRYFFAALLFMMYSSNCTAEDDSFFKPEQWQVSGYLKLAFEAPNQKPTAIILDDLSLFVSAHINRWLNPFIEAELYSVPLWESGRGFQMNQVHFTIERLYNDIKINNEDTLRLGKFLAPVSRWNKLHAAPLVWTTNRPITTQYSYANYISGVQFRHEFDLFSGQAVEVYIQPYKEFFNKPIIMQDRLYRWVLGATWVIEEDLDAYYALSFQHADVDEGNEGRTTLSFNAFLQRPSFEFESEFLVTFIETDQAQIKHQDWGGYVQMSVPILWDLHLISRYEHFEFANKVIANDSLLSGVVYRPYSKLSLKLEWQQTWGSIYKNGSGLYASIAVMF